jgi:hypothetical protein
MMAASRPPGPAHAPPPPARTCRPPTVARPRHGIGARLRRRRGRGGAAGVKIWSWWQGDVCSGRAAGRHAQGRGQGVLLPAGAHRAGEHESVVQSALAPPLRRELASRWQWREGTTRFGCAELAGRQWRWRLGVKKWWHRVVVGILVTREHLQRFAAGGKTGTV